MENQCGTRPKRGPPYDSFGSGRLLQNTGSEWRNIIVCFCGKLVMQTCNLVKSLNIDTMNVQGDT